MSDEIKDHLIALGIFGQRAADLSTIPGITVEIIDDAFRRSNPNDTPIAIADNIEQRAEARGRNLERLKEARREECRRNESRRRVRDRYNIDAAQQVRDEIEIITSIPADELETLIAEVTKTNPWITIHSATKNRMLRCLVIGRMEGKKGRS